MEAIVLVGGLGTRLRSSISNLPKPMAPINGKPFLEYVLKYLARNRVTRIVLATGYMHEKIEAYFGYRFDQVPLVYSVEDEPLGTGGAFKRAISEVLSGQVVLMNGDTFFDIEIAELSDTHQRSNADLTIALKPMKNISRYGIVRTDGSRVVSFEEKQARESGHINAGLYVGNRGLFEHFELPAKFSFEEDFLKKYTSKLHVAAHICEGYFIDIGIPKDYKRACRELPHYE